MPLRHAVNMRIIPRAGRLPAPTRDDLARDAQRVYDGITTGERARGGLSATVADADGRLQGPYNAMVHASPAIGDALQQLGAAIRFHGALPDRVRELAILTVSAVRECTFEWQVHAAAAARLGISDDIIESIARQDGAFLDGVDALVHRATTELVQGRDLSQDTWEKLTETLGVQAAIDLMALVGYFDTMALLLRALRVPLPGE